MKNKPLLCVVITFYVTSFYLATLCSATGPVYRPAKITMIKPSKRLVNIRSGPSTKHKIVYQLTGGTRIDVKVEKGNWLWIMYWNHADKRPRDGWVYKTLVSGYKAKKKKKRTPKKKSYKQTTTPQTVRQEIEKDSVKSQPTAIPTETPSPFPL